MLSKLHITILFFIFTVSMLARTPSVEVLPSLHNDSNQSLDTKFILTYWKLTSLFSEKVDSSVMLREAHVVFQTLDNGRGKFKGATGCNDMIGTYQSIEYNLTINDRGIAMTRKACAKGDVEVSLLKAMHATVLWKIKDNHLSFIDMNSSVLAEFRAIKFK